ncbi:MAG: peptidylprolyl isomerase [Clostridiales bacterium]|nr:peptidylprolyl isomerase [Clostridiales bacterium]
MRKNKIATLVLAGLFVLSALTGCIKYQTPDDFKPTNADGEEYLSGLHHVEIEVQDYGTISVELDADTAPRTVTNFIDLAESGFYNGLTFHRIKSGFMIQGGDPEGTGSGGSGTTITGEFSANGYENDISHVRGTISMARNGMDYNSASSQFFIVHEDSLFLDGKYAGFGHVTDGMDIVDAICEDTPVTDDNGTVADGYQPVITEIRVID